MNALASAAPKTLQLVDIIDFKWLMSGLGHRVHVERLQADKAYAEQCLALADASPSAQLREAAGRLRRLLSA